MRASLHITRMQESFQVSSRLYEGERSTVLEIDKNKVGARSCAWFYWSVVCAKYSVAVARWFRNECRVKENKISPFSVDFRVLNIK